MNKDENVVKEVKEEVKKPATRTKKTATAAASDNKAKKAPATTKAKAPAKQESPEELAKKLEKSITSKKKVYIEYYGKQVSEEEIAKRLFEALKENGFKETIKSLNIYFKAEENTAYCVINDGEPLVLNF